MEIGNVNLSPGAGVKIGGEDPIVQKQGRRPKKAGRVKMLVNDYRSGARKSGKQGGRANATGFSRLSLPLCVVRACDGRVQSDCRGDDAK